MSPLLRLRARSDPPPRRPEDAVALRAAINAVVYRTLKPALVGLGGLYLVFAAVHPIFLPAAVAPTMSALALLTALACGAQYLYVRRMAPESERVHVFAVGLGLLALANCIAHLYLTGEPRQTTNLLLFVMAGGYLYLSTPWFAGVLVATLGAWVGVFLLLPPSPDWSHYGFALVEASVISVVIHLLRRQATLRVEQMRLQEERQRIELQAAKEQAEEMARLKTSFLANMSHEIRTPLTSILGFAEILREETTGTYQELSAVIHESGLRLLDTLNSVLDFARLEAGRMALHAEPLDVAAAVVPAVQLLEPLARKRGLGLHVDVRAPDAWARLDPSALDRMLNNLVGNALKFTEQGGVTVTVDATADAVRIAVRDTGVGIAAGFLPHLFDEFRQESSGLARSHEGSGLGLAITRRLVELMGGTILVESEKGTGSTFTLSFPRLPDAEAAEHGRPGAFASGRRA